MTASSDGWPHQGFVAPLLAPLLMLALAACGGGSGATGNSTQNPTVQPPAPEPDPHDEQIARFLSAGSPNLGEERVTLPQTSTYVPLQSAGVDTSVIEGVGVNPYPFRDRNGFSYPNTGRAYVYGTRNNLTGEIMVSNTRAVMLDPDGSSSLDPDRLLFVHQDPEGPSQVLSLSGANLQDYAGLFVVRSTDEAGTIEGNVMALGVSTFSDDMPASGSAFYQGAGEIWTSELGREAAILDATSRVLVNFSDGTVNARVTNGANGHDIRADGMRIDANTFSGGTVSYRFRGDDRTMGFDMVQDAAGLFYGPNTGTQPAEVGGYITLVSDVESVTGIYVVE